jgi:hypothetical protein
VKPALLTARISLVELRGDTRDRAEPCPVWFVLGDSRRSGLHPREQTPPATGKPMPWRS